MKIKTAEATGSALDWLVARLEKVAVRWSPAHELLLIEGHNYLVWQPHAHRMQGGPIIDRLIDEGYMLEKAGFDLGVRFIKVSAPEVICVYGSTVLIAAMRCHVINQLGDEAEVPDEIVEFERAANQGIQEKLNVEKFPVKREFLKTEVLLIGDTDAYRDVDIFIPGIAGDYWLFRRHLDKESDAIINDAPRYAETANLQLEETDKMPPAEVLAALASVNDEIVALLRGESAVAEQLPLQGEMG